MKQLNLITLAIVIIGGLVWGLLGLFESNLVEVMFGESSVVARIVYLIVGASALWQLVPLFNAFNAGEVSAQRGHPMR